jgi:DNA repair ATPase RecN
MDKIIEKKLKMLHDEKRTKFMKIQFFAEGEDGAGDDSQGKDTPKTYTEEEYQKLKSSLDKALKEVSEAKKRERDRMTDDERKEEEQNAINQKIADYESKIQDYELKGELMKSDIFSNEEMEKIVSKKTNVKELLNEMIKMFKEKVENAKKEAIQKYMQSSDVSGSGGNGKDSQDPDVESFIKGLEKNSSKKARDYYLGK